MRRTPFTAATLILVCLAPLAHGQDAAKKAPAGGKRLLVPTFWQSPEPLAADKAYVLRSPRGRIIEAQADEKNRLWWMGMPRQGAGAMKLEVREAGSLPEHVKVERAGDEQINVTFDGQPFTTFNYKKDEPRPYLYPVLAPTGGAVTRNWPMKDVAEERDAKPKQQDHEHHRSLWTAHGDVRTPAHPDKGTDYWAMDIADKETHKITHRKDAGYQRVTKIVRTVSGPVFGLIEAEVSWTTVDGKQELTDTRTYRFFRGTDGQRVIDYTLVLHFPDSDVTFAMTKEGGLLSTRVATSMTEKPGKGHMVNSKGQKGMQACWGEPTDWCDYVGPVDEKTVGVAIFDAPANFRHPVRWHIRDYGLYTANPFMGRMDDKKITEDGSASWKKGESVTFSYRYIVHKGDTDEARIADQYATYAQPPKVVVEK